MTKKGQGLPLNTIIIAIIVLVVLVVLIAIFTGRIVIFERQLSDADQTDILQMKVSYGSCYPDANAEKTYLDALSNARKTSDANDDVDAKADFQGVISRCASSTSPTTGCTGRCGAQ
jgi:hypothetical protein